MAPKPLPDQSLLLQLLRYDRRSGKLYWRARDVGRGAAAFNSRFAGKEAGAVDPTKCGYVIISIDGRSYRAHRIIWKMVHGTEPEEIDHRNGIRPNNRLKNLRESTRFQNMKNCQNTRNTSGKLGLEKTRSGHWCSRIHSDGKRIYLGTFADKASAIAAREAAEVKYGYDKRHGTRSRA